MPSFAVFTKSPKTSSLFNMFSTWAIIIVRCLNRHHVWNNIRYKGNTNNTSVIIFFNWHLSHFSLPYVSLPYVIGRLNKTPSDGACLGEPPGGFCDVSFCCCFPYWRFLRFRTTFPCHRHSTLASQAREDLHQLWVLSWLLRLLYFCLFIFTASATVLSGHFSPTDVFYLAFLPHIFDTFCDSSEGRNTPSRILLCACHHRVVPSGWGMEFNYSIVVTRPLIYGLRQWTTKYRVKIKLMNMIRLFEVYRKTIKTLWTRLDKKYCLKLLWRNCLISIHRSLKATTRKAAKRHTK